MKKHTIYFGLFFLLLLTWSCTELTSPARIADDILSQDTKGMSREYYYWYHGKTIPLTIDKDFINILVDTMKVKAAEIPGLCAEWGLEMVKQTNRDGLFKAHLNQGLDYWERVSALRRDGRILCVLPFFEDGADSDPVGTSSSFYVRLKEVVPDDKIAEQIPYLEKQFDIDALTEEAERLGVSIKGGVPYMPDWYILTIEGSEFENAVDASNQLFETGRFEEVDPAFQLDVRLNTVNDPLFSQQWGLKNTINAGYDINVEGAWAISTAGAARKVAVVDGFIDPDHNDLMANFSYAQYDPLGSVLDSNGHGTHVAGIIGVVGNNNLQIAGVAYNSTILRVRTFLNGYGLMPDLAPGISWAWQNGAEVINCSWHMNSGSLYASAVESAITNALTFGRDGLGSIVVFASGNENNSTVSYPGSFDDRILTVGAIGSSGTRASFSNYGTKLDVVAPGEDILSLLPNNSIGTASGTSMAAPHASGVAALMLSVNSYLKREEVVRILQQTAKKISPGGLYSFSPRNYSFSDETWNQEVGCGLINAKLAVSIASALGTAPSTAFDPGMNIFFPEGISSNQHEGTTSGYFPQTVYASLLPANVNSSYTYYWYVSAPAHPNWHPGISYISGYNASISIPQPVAASTLYIRCLVYNGESLVATPSFTLHVNP